MHAPGIAAEILFASMNFHGKKIGAESPVASEASREYPAELDRRPNKNEGQQN